MTRDVMKPGSPFDQIRRVDENGEYWLARDLQPLLGYAQWRRFNDTINRARVSVAAAGGDVRHHFSQVSQVADAGNLGNQTRSDFRMTRYGCYLVAMNGDTSKREIADAQQYFAVQTRKAEVIEQQQALPGTYLEALKALVTEVEAKERAELLQAQAEAERDELKPPAEAWQTLADTGQDYSVREASYILKRDPAIADRVGPRRLFDWIVRTAMAQRKPDGQYVPYAAHGDHLRLAPRSRPDRDGGLKEAHSQLRVTVKGLEWIQQKMREETRPELVAAPPQETADVVDIHSVRTALMRR